MNNKGTGPVGLVLSGGGGKGAYQIGVWYALKEYGIDKMITHVAGTSVGALNACLFTMGDYDHAEDVWSSLAIDDVLTFDQVKATAWATKLREQGLLGTLSESTLRLFSKNRSDGFFSREKLGQLIEYEVDFSALRNSQIQTYATCYDKSTMSAAYFNLKKYKANTIKEILLASSAIPVVFDSHSVQKHEYYDGGIVDNTPISPLYNEGVRDFIVVHLSQSSLVDRSKFLDSRFIEIVPQQDMGNLFSGTLNFSQRTIRSRMEAGYDDTKALLGSLRGNHLFEDQSIPLQGETMAIVPYANRDKVVSSANRERVESSLQNLYFDFEQNREDYLFEDGRTAYPGLVSQLKAIKKRFGSAFLPHLSSEDDILDDFINIFFPSDYPRDFYVSNVSLEQSTRLLMFRPTVTTPSLGRVLPSGTTIFIQCRIWDDSKDPDNGVLQARRIIACPDSPPRDFEVPLRGVVISGADKVYPLRNRSSNVLTQEFIEKIPLISEKTKSNTQLWSEYLNWREKLLQRQLKGLRYFEREIFDGDKLRFSVISESNESFRDQQRILRSNELYAYDLSYSKDQLRFAYDEDQWINSNEGVELGVFNGFQDTGRQLPEGVSVPWKDPYTAVVVYQLPDELLARIASTDAESEQAELRRDFLDKLPEQGFLSLSIVGDLVLLQRQRKELQKLREESGSAPFLSSYLFDISKAHVPTALVEIRDDEWMHSNLNEDQRAAVRKMLSVRDLCLIQGPPGTGKTTMIAEATWQFINQGKRVLVVSQASLAVNNVLERLPRVPGTRAIRLSKRERRNEREHPYSKSNALKTYFNSIAESCRENFLNVWEKNEKQLIHFKKLKTNFEYLLRDYEEICSLESIHRAKRLELDSKRKQVLGQKFQYDQKNALPKKELEEFLQFLEERAASTTSIPDLLEPAFFKTLILPIQGLVQKGFNPNVFSPHYVEGIPSQKEKASIEVFSAWKRLYHLRMQVAQDLQAFRESSTALHLKTSLYTEFLDRDNTLNQALFSGDGYLIEPLESLYEVLNQSEMLLDDAKNKLIQKTQQLLGQMGQSDVYTHQLISLDNKLFATDSELKECQWNKTSKEQKMKDLCAEYMGKANTPPIFDSEEVTRIQDSLKADISRIETE
ncbi:MAG: patatin-like phospholipase family protein, partial [Sphaerochaeta associata]|uniref:patatin-like phospholipase family protein n=1 Tax=Sphaerochaeta associata TaxID=1129264 RepID=UPI002B1F69FC